MIDWKPDTLERKPKLYHVAILSAVFLAALALLFALGGERLARFGCLLTAVYGLAVTALLLRAFRLQIRYKASDAISARYEPEKDKDYIKDKTGAACDQAALVCVQAISFRSN